MFKSWSGGALVTEAYYSFFAEVWKGLRFTIHL